MATTNLYQPRPCRSSTCQIVTGRRRKAARSRAASGGAVRCWVSGRDLRCREQTDPTEHSRWRPLRLLLAEMDEDIDRLYADAGIEGLKPSYVMELLRGTLPGR
jgi:hypothetical protein